ncbi:MAG: HIT family protein [Candidatus Hodarchaeales archaeon]
MPNCVFCEIVQGLRPAYKLYEDKNTLTFLDISPLNPGHSLIITKQHISNIYEISEEDIASVAITTSRVAKALKKVLNCEGINILNTNEKAAWQEVDHLHFHLIPRWFDDNIVFMADRGELKSEDEFIENIKKEINDLVNK